MRKKSKSYLKKFFAIAIAVGLAFGCAPMLRQKPPTLSGTFKGNAQDGRPVTVTFQQDEDTITGRGKIEDRAFSLSGLISWHGPIVLNYEDGSIKPAYVMLSADGGTVTLNSLGQSIILNQGGESQRAPSGPFAGRYNAIGPPYIWLNLTQGGNLLAGSGFVDGKPVAVVGKVIGVNSAVGTILFSDESQSRARATLSDNGRVLTVEGLGAPIQMRRE